MSVVASASRDAPAVEPTGQVAGGRRFRFVAVAVAVAATAIFAVLHGRLEMTAPWAGPGDSASVRGALAADMCRYLALAGGAVCLVVLGRRRTFFLPAFAYSLTPWIVGWNDTCWPPNRALAAVGGGWPIPASLDGCISTTDAGPFGVAVDLMLALAPAAALVFVTGRRGAERLRQASQPHASNAARIGSLALVTFIVWSVAWVLATTGYGGFPMSSLAPDLVPLLLFGVLVGTWRLRWAWTLVAVPVLLTTYWPAPLAAMGTWPTAPEFRQALPYLATPVIGAAWRPLATMLEWGSRRPIALLGAVNALNVADAIFTHVALRSGEAVEANPIVRLIGLPLKIVLVGGLSLMLYRLRPRALTFVTLALVGVLAWHLAGFAAIPR